MDDVLFVLTFAFALLVLAVPGAARGGDAVVLSLTPARSASFPHDCDWTWDVEQERCWWDRSGTLLVGGDGARTWRGGVRFDFSGLPPGLALVDGSLAVPDLGVCLGLGP